MRKGKFWGYSDQDNNILFKNECWYTKFIKGKSEQTINVSKSTKCVKLVFDTSYMDKLWKVENLHIRPLSSKFNGLNKFWKLDLILKKGLVRNAFSLILNRVFNSIEINAVPKNMLVVKNTSFYFKKTQEIYMWKVEEIRFELFKPQLNKEGKEYEEFQLL